MNVGNLRDLLARILEYKSLCISKYLILTQVDFESWKINNWVIKKSKNQNLRINIEVVIIFLDKAKNLR